MLEAGSVAVVGASVKDGSLGLAMMQELLRGGFEGAIYPVNPGYEEILGLAGHKPFECVGDYDEARAALRMAAEHDGWRATVLLPELVDAVDRITPSSHAVDMRRLLGDSGLHVIPVGYQEALRAVG